MIQGRRYGTVDSATTPPPSLLLLSGGVVGGLSVYRFSKTRGALNSHPNLGEISFIPMLAWEPMHAVSPKYRSAVPFN